MEFVTVEEFKTFEGLKSPEGDAQLSFIISGVNSLISSILGVDNLNDYVNKTSIKPIQILLSTDAKASDITVTNEDGDILEGLIGVKGVYTLNNDFVGVVNFEVPNPLGATIPSDLKMAAIYLVKYFRSNEYKASMSGAGQSVTFVSLSSNIPKHVMSVLSLYRPI